MDGQEAVEDQGPEFVLGDLFLEGKNCQFGADFDQFLLCPWKIVVQKVLLMKTLHFCFWFKNRDKENCNSWQRFSRQYHICYEWPILLRRFLSFHCALNCSLGCFSIPKCAAFGLKGWNLTQNSSVQSVKKSPWQEKRSLREKVWKLAIWGGISLVAITPVKKHLNSLWQIP